MRLLLGDCVEVMAGMEAESVDAVVTDPPYGLEFMGKEWDALGGGARKSGAPGIGARPTEWVSNTGWNRMRCRSCGHLSHGGSPCKCDSPDFAAADERMRRMQEWHEAWAREALRVLRPGGHLLAFGGTRTFHRLTCAIEDAGFEIRDCLSWLYGSGFPKSLDVSKAIDRAAGAEREVVPGGSDGVVRRPRLMNPGGGETLAVQTLSDPATPDAQRWQGWGTALKPAWEPIIVARKPLAGTVAGNVLAHGTGALNVDGCRVGKAPGDRTEYGRGRTLPHNGGVAMGEWSEVTPYEPHTAGRWPANVVLSHTPDCREVGVRKVRTGTAVQRHGGGRAIFGGIAGTTGDGPAPDEGYAGADGTETVPAFDCSPDCPVRLLDEQAGERPSASSRSRPEHQASSYHISDDIGLRTCEYAGDTGGPSRFFYTAKASPAERDGTSHPTVKPLALMRWLVRLVTPPGGLVLDPFTGSGTTLIACKLEGFRAIGIEREQAYCEMATERYRRRYDPSSASWDQQSDDGQLNLLGGAA